MGYRGKVYEQEHARAMRAGGMTLLDIATALGVSKSSVSVWVRDVPFTPSPRRTGPKRRTHPAAIAKQAEIERCRLEGIGQIGRLSADAFLAAGTALYAGEGSKNDGKVLFANTDARMVSFFCAWLRCFFDIDESRMRARVYLHDGLDLDAAEEFWSETSGVPRSQFRERYRARADATIRHAKHVHGCVYVYYCCSTTHRRIMGLVGALLSSDAIPG